MSSVLSQAFYQIEHGTILKKKRTSSEFSNEMVLDLIRPYLIYMHQEDIVGTFEEFDRGRFSHEEFTEIVQAIDRLIASSSFSDNMEPLLKSAMEALIQFLLKSRLAVFKISLARLHANEGSTPE